MTERAAVDGALTVGQVAEQFGVTVRTLHHYDEIGLVRPHRTASGYRVYTDDDLERLRHVVVYRRLGFPLEEIGPLLDDPHADVQAHLRRQRAAVVSRLDEMRDLVAAIDRALEAQMNGMALTPEEQKELFGEGFSEEYAREAEERWGDTDACRQSQERTRRYTKDDWRRIAAEGEEVTARFAALKQGGHAGGLGGGDGRRRGAPGTDRPVVLRRRARDAPRARRHVPGRPTVHQDLRRP